MIEIIASNHQQNLIKIDLTLQTEISTYKYILKQYIYIVLQVYLMDLVRYITTIYSGCLFKLGN